jgi:hypothetical protein
MPVIYLDTGELELLTSLVLNAFQGARYPDSDRTRQLRNILRKLAPDIEEQKPGPDQGSAPPSEPGDGPRYGKGGSAKRERSRR